MTNQFVQIATHSGPVFHDDDVVAVAILSKIFPNNQIIRTRDPFEIDTADIVVDVGHVYNHALRRYDHHMQNPPTDENGHVFSSAGLIWKHYARTYLETIKIPKSVTLGQVTIDLITEVEIAVRNKWIYPIDMVDNGEISGPTVISEIVRSCRPISVEKTREKSDEQFLRAVEIVSEILERTCFHFADQAITNGDFLNASKRYLSDHRIMISDRIIPNINLLCGTSLHFAISPVKDYIDEDTKRWFVSPVRITPNRTYKTHIPAKLLGLEEKEIFENTGIRDVVFIHNTGFITSCRTEEAAVEFCEYLLNQNKTNLE